MPARDFVAGAMVGAAVTVAIPVTFLVVTGMAGPAGRAARRIGGILRAKAREAGIESMEVIEDFIAEVQAGPGRTHEHPAADAAEPGPAAKAVP